MTTKYRSHQEAMSQLSQKLSGGEKLVLVDELYRTVREFHAKYVRWRNPAATDQDIGEDWMAFTLEPELFRKVKEHMRRHEEQTHNPPNEAEPSIDPEPLILDPNRRRTPSADDW